MRAIVLGAAAGGGFPQWNAGSEACVRARAGDPAARPATQASLAVSADGARWLLVEASPDLRQQIEATAELHPKRGPRSSPIAAVIPTNGEIDSIGGLLHLREGTPFALYAHPRILALLDANPVFEVVDRAIVPRRPVPLERRIALEDAHGVPLGLEVRAFPVAGKPPLFLEKAARGGPPPRPEPGDVVGLEIASGGRRIVWIANCGRLEGAVLERCAGADVVFVDGTLWRDDELVCAGIAARTGRDMGHVSISGEEGVLARLGPVPARRKILVHLNNTNPVLLADSPERALVERAGFEVGHDGLVIDLPGETP
ncbi:MAG: pyrroloquinoline quinone biosynthesis protein PqqB [Geminicoccaceae bacterium]|nr:pyrroloquinoline quinone biosynthesis protein PqqB [Geminicoccaceae bacterium]